jgi:hypothetical protein
MLDMTECGRTQSQDGRADQRVGDDLDAEDIGETWAAVVAEGAKDEILALLVEDEDTRDHVEAWWLVARGGRGINNLATCYSYDDLIVDDRGVHRQRRTGKVLADARPNPSRCLVQHVSLLQRPLACFHPPTLHKASSRNIHPLAPIV